MPERIPYEFLLDLYRGRATAVEQIADDLRKRLAVSTPVTRFLQEADTDGTKHVFLTGNAGDGKTFAICSSDVQHMEVILDASAVLADAGDPLEGLAAQIEQTLTDGNRLLAAINRGQMERLTGFVQQHDAYPQARDLLEEAQPLLQLHVEPLESSPHVSVIDLGLFDTLSDAVLDPVLNKVAGWELDGLTKGPTHAATSAAQAALQEHGIREFVKTSLRRSRASGQHVTMRQIWSVVAYLLTGGRAAADVHPEATLADSVGARLFSEASRSPLLAAYRTDADPCLVAQPRLAQAVLNRSWRQYYEALPGLEGLLILPDSDSRGRTLARAGAVHGASIAERPKVPSDPFALVVTHLRDKNGWRREAPITGRLLSGAYASLGLWYAEGTYPAWERLCFDATRAGRAGVAAFATIDRQQLEIALPRPNRAVIDALGNTWWPPYVLLAFKTEGGRHSIRLTPRIFRSLYTEDEVERRSMMPAEKLLIERWLSGARTTEPSQDRVWIGNLRQPALRIKRDPLASDYTISFNWQGG